MKAILKWLKTWKWKFKLLFPDNRTHWFIEQQERERQERIARRRKGSIVRDAALAVCLLCVFLGFCAVEGM